LDNTEEGLIRSFGVQAFFSPAVGADHGLGGVGFISYGGGGFIKGEDDIGADFGLNIDGRFRIEIKRGAVDRGLKVDTIFGDFDMAGLLTEGNDRQGVRNFLVKVPDTFIFIGNFSDAVIQAETETKNLKAAGIGH